MTYITKNEKETRALAKRIAPQLRGGDILLLKGELGSGKTTFVKGLARSLGVKAKIKSPTFILMHQHKIKNQKSKIKTFVHCDAYRIKNARSLKDIGLTDYIGKSDAIVVIEWGEKVRILCKKACRVWNLSFLHGKTADARVIQISRVDNFKK